MPAATTKRNASSQNSASPSEEPDLLAGLTDDSSSPAAIDDETSYDLLDGLTEDNGTPWIPDDDDDPSPEGIQGRVTFRGEIPSEYGPDPIPVVELKGTDGTEWSVRGYSTALRNQIEKADPQPGDFAAFRYFGVKTAKKSGRDYKNFKVATKRG